MAKVLSVEDEEQVDRSHPGCMSSIFHVKKIRPRRKRNRRYKRISDDQEYFEVLKLFDVETSHILVDQSDRKTLRTLRRSLKVRKKALISEDNENDKKQDQEFVSSPKLQRTYSIHHLETNEWVHPIIFFPENVTESAVSPITHINLTTPEVNDSRDILEMFKVDKELFTHMLQDRSLSYDTEPKLTKSGSFPSACNSVSRNLMPMKLEDKLNEIYTIVKAEKMKNSNDDANGKNVIRLRRVSSLNESATRFLDFSDGKEATLRTSRSLKLTNGSENLLRNDLNQATEYHTPDEKVQISEGFQEIVEKDIKSVNNKKHMESSTKDDDFTYVKKILERSGFIKNGFEQTWHSTNQPLDPFVFQVIESHYVHDPRRFEEEVNELSHRLLIFDLVDEVLRTMYERSFTYYPKKLSSYCHISPSQNGSLVLDEVWNCVSRLLNFEHDINESLNDIVSRDLKSDDGWMLMDSESVGFDMEDLILEEVLEEVVFELI